MKPRVIVILGGYGNFGKRIAQSLLDLADTTLVIAGRNPDKAARLCQQWAARHPAAHLQAARLDTHSPGFEAELGHLNPTLVIHTSGPFQGQDYRVPLACIRFGAHYIDLADDRRFVCDITQLDQQAKARGVLLVSGASSVPGLSSVVIDHYLPRYQTLKTIDFAIAPGNKAERGEATVRAILSYTGRPFKVWRNAQWVTVFGWGESGQRDFGGDIGKRWLADIDIPDLELFPTRYPGVETVRFQAGLEVPVLHHGMRLLAWLTRLGLVAHWAPLTKPIIKASELFLPFGTDKGAMQITLKGLDHQHQPLQIDWTLYANGGVGPYIPTLSATILTRQLLDQSLTRTGAMACLGLYTLDAFDQYARPWGIYHRQRVSGPGQKH